MSKIQYNLQFEKLCGELQLGNLICPPDPISGGLLNKMYVVQTTKGKYAVKAINPQIMLRPEAMQNYINSEHIANIAAKYVPAVSAIIFNGKSIQMIDGQFYLVFYWIEGKSLKRHEIKIIHCKKVGEILAKMHKINSSDFGLINNSSGEEKVTDWHYYLKEGEKCNAVWAELLTENIDNLYDWNNQSAVSSKLLATDTVISHRDLDPKNIMWDNDTPYIIDWEAAGFINPMHDLLDTAIYWSTDELKNIDKAKFIAFIDTYRNNYGKLHADWKAVLGKGYSGNLGWLEYSLKRSLRIECNDEAEQQMGTGHVTETINVLRNYSNIVKVIEEWLFDYLKNIYGNG